MRIFLLCVLAFTTGMVQGQYDFTIDKKLSCTEVKNQQKTGTCWSFATASFIESEIIRKTGSPIDISEMFIVRKIYEDKAQNYFLRQGKANFSQGSLSHDLLRTMELEGLIPDRYYSGKTNGQKIHDHAEMESGLKGYLDGVIASRRKGNNWRKAVSAILDIYLGAVPSEFDIDGKKMSAINFKNSMNISADEYMSFTSFTHHPFYSDFILEIPDNYSNGAYTNIPMADLSTIVDFAIAEGYSVAWDGDVSEKGFSSKHGIAVLPKDGNREDLFSVPGEEAEADQKARQIAFENTATTDDHLMHLIGISFDQNGNKYYLIKNSWGEIGPFDGYIHMSEQYLKMKTVAITLHKDAIPAKIMRELNKRSN